MHIRISQKRLFAPLFSLVLFFVSFGSVALVPVYADTVSTSGFNTAMGSSMSRNWSGYTATGGGYTTVDGSWTVPSATLSSAGVLNSDASWVGIGGVRGTDLIQTGTIVTLSGSNVLYQAWYEILPATAQIVPLTVKPGDSITANITEQSSNIWLVVLKDNTTGQSYQTTLPYVSSHSSAEWVEEMPVNVPNHTYFALDNFGTVNFTNSWAVRNGSTATLASLSAQPLTMIDASRQVLAQTSVIGGDGQSFSVMRANTHVASTASATYPNSTVTFSVAPTIRPLNLRTYRLTYKHVHVRTSRRT